MQNRKVHNAQSQPQKYPDKESKSEQLTGQIVGRENSNRIVVGSIVA